jgi:hypothetical protein
VNVVVCLVGNDLSHGLYLMFVESVETSKVR